MVTIANTTTTTTTNATRTRKSGTVVNVTDNTGRSISVRLNGSEETYLDALARCAETFGVSTDELVASVTDIGAVPVDCFDAEVVRSILNSVPSTGAEVCVARKMLSNGVTSVETSSDRGAAAVVLAGGSVIVDVDLRPGMTLYDTIHSTAVRRASGMTDRQLDSVSVIMNGETVQPDAYGRINVVDGDSLALTIRIAQSNG